MKILVTGASGFIGNRVIDELLKDGNNEIVATAYKREEAEKYDWINKVSFIACDLNENNNRYFSDFGRPDALIHLSWQGLPNYKELFHIENNLMHNYFFIKNMVQGGLKKAVVIGTCFEYGMQNGCLNEEMPAKPVTPYGLAKDTLRKFIGELVKIYNFEFNWIRLFYLYGKGQGENSLLSQLHRALENDDKVFNMSGGEQLRDYLPVEKVAEYIVRITLQNEVNGIINCCSGTPISVRKFVEDYLKSINREIRLNLGYYPYPDFEPMAFWGDDSIIRKILKREN